MADNDKKDGLKMAGLPPRIDGRVASRKSGVYRPSKGNIKRYLQGCVPKLDQLEMRYVPFGDEKQYLDIAKEIGSAALLVGEPGTGKTLLVREYAAENKMPLLILSASGDLTEYKTKGGLTVTMLPSRDENGVIHDLRFMEFTPSLLSLVAMADMPAILFIDDIQNIRPEVSSLIHSVANERELPLYDSVGENFRLHKDVMIIAASNVDLVTGGIEGLSEALRERLDTIYFPVPGAERFGKVGDVLYKTLQEKGGLSSSNKTAQKNIGNFERIKKQLSEVCGEIVQLMSDFRAARTGTFTPGRGNVTLESEVLSGLTGVPSMRTFVRALKAMLAGKEVGAAIEHSIVHTITNDFEKVSTGLMTYIESRLEQDLFGKG